MNNIQSKSEIVSEHFTLVFASLIFVINLLVLFSWINGWMLIARFSFDEIPMSPSSAVIFIILGTCLWFFPRFKLKPIYSYIAVSSKILVIVFSVIIFFMRIYGHYPDWEHFFIHVPKTHIVFEIGHISIVTTMLFFISGSTMLLLHSNRKEFKNISFILTTVIFTISLILLLGYAAGTPFFYTGNIYPPAALTSFSFLLLSLCLFSASYKTTFLVEKLFENSTVAKLLRTFLPVILGLTLLEGIAVARILPILNIHPALGQFLLTLFFVTVIIFSIPGIAKYFGKSLDVATENLRLSEKKFSKAFRNSPFMISIINTIDETLFEVNNNFLDVSGFTRTEVIGKTAAELGLILPKDRRRLTEEVNNKWKLSNIDITVFTKDKRAIPCLINGELLKIEGKDMLLCIVQDISERKKIEEYQAQLLLDLEKNKMILLSLLEDHLETEEALRESENKYRKLVELSPDAVLILINGIIQFANTASLKLFDELNMQHLIGKKIMDIVHPDQKNIVLEKISELKKGKDGVSVLEVKFLSIKGKVFDAEVSAVPITLMSQNGVQVIVRDITERKKAEIILKQSEKEFRDIFQNAHDAILILDLKDEIVLEVNSRALEIYGFTQEEFIGRSMKTLSKFPEMGEKEIKKVLQKGFISNFETTHIRKDGTELILEINGSLVEYKGNKVILSINHDITARKKLEKEIQVSNQKLRALSNRLQNIRETERLSLSRELHDNVGQALTGLNMDICWLEKKFYDNKSNRELTANRFYGMKKLIDDTIIKVREISTELRPSILDSFGLLSAIEWLLQDIEQRSGIVCSLISRWEALNFNQQTSLEIFRIIQESLTNIIRHARATKVSLSIQKMDHSIVFDIKDNGKGILKDAINNIKSLGLLGMYERAAQINSKISIIGEKGKGTIITLSVPVME